MDTAGSEVTYPRLRQAEDSMLRSHNDITGNGVKWRNDIYVKASGLKESSLSLRDELLRPHGEEVAEITVLKNGIEDTVGSIRLLDTRTLTEEFPGARWEHLANSVITRLLDTELNIKAIRIAYQMKVATLDTLEQRYCPSVRRII